MKLLPNRWSYYPNCGRSAQELQFTVVDLKASIYNFQFKIVQSFNSSVHELWSTSALLDTETLDRMKPIKEA